MRTVVTALMLLVVLGLAAGACFGGMVGARPMAMGGAFIGLADDANATFYNPAGLAQMPAGLTLGTWTHTADNRDEFGYKEFASITCSFASKGLIKKIGVGASYVAADSTILLGAIPTLDEQQWYWGSVAVDTGSLGMFGVNVRKVDSTVLDTSSDSDWAIDAGYLYKFSPDLSVGILAQDVNEPVTRIEGIGSYSRFINWRAGLAYKAGGMTLTVDGYDLADNAGLQSARVGAELAIRDLTLRAGYYGFGSDFEKGPAVGLGLSKELYDIDATLLMGDFDNTIIVSAGFKMM